MGMPLAFWIVVASMVAFFAIGWYSRRWTSTAAEFYVAGGRIPWRLNAVAMFANYASAASFLGVAGAIALGGIDSWWIALGFFAAWIVAVLVLTGPLRRSGKYTVADALAERFSSLEIRLLTVVVAVVIGTLYLVPQLVGAGHLFGLLLGWDYTFTVFVAGAFTALIVVLGGMRGTTYNQVLQGALMFVAMAVLFVGATALFFGGNPLEILNRADGAVAPMLAVPVADAITTSFPPGSEGLAGLAAVDAARSMLPDAASAMTPGIAVPDLANQLSLVLGLFLGVVGLPHVLVRLYTVKDARAAQKSAEFTIVGLAVFYVMSLFVGLAAMLLLYPDLVHLLATGQRGLATNTAVAMLGQMLGGEWLLGFVAAAAMGAILSTTIGLLMQMTTTIAHDGYTALLRPQSGDRERLRVARVAGLALTILAVIASLGLKDENVAVLVTICFGIASSTFAPVLLLAVWWRRLTREGVIAGFLVGLVVSLTFTVAHFIGMREVLGLTVLGNPALYSVPAAIAAVIVVSLLTRDVGAVDHFMALAHGRPTAQEPAPQPAPERG